MSLSELNPLAMGPISTLQWKGRLCPCLEGESNRHARQALQALQEQNVVLWYPRGTTNNSNSLKEAAASVKSNVVNLFRSAFSKQPSLSDHDDQDDGSFRDEPSASNNNNTMAESVLAHFEIRDQGMLPQLSLDPTKLNKNNPNASVGFQLAIALRRIGTVQVDPATKRILILAKQRKKKKAKPVRRSQRQSSFDSNNDDTPNTPKVLVTLELQQAQSDDSNDPSSFVPVSSDETNMFVHHLLVLVEWERQRRLALKQQQEERGDASELDSDSDSDSDDDGGGNFLQRRAAQAAQFAQREIEMQQTKRQRQQRKAQLLADSKNGGGLKYTALAMMQRAQEKEDQSS